MKIVLTAFFCLILLTLLSGVFSTSIVSAVDCSTTNCGSGNGFCGCSVPPTVTCSDQACTQNCIVTCPTQNNCVIGDGNLKGDAYCSQFGASCPASTSDKQFFDETVTCNTSNGNCESTCPYFSCTVDTAAPTGSTNGTATAKATGTALDGYDRIDWYANNILNGTNIPSNGDGSVSLLSLSPNTAYTVKAVYWTSNNQPILRPSITCSSSPSFLTYPAAPPTSSLSASCPAPGTSAAISFGSSPGGTSQYNLRVNDNNDSDGNNFNPINYPTNPAGDFAINNAGQSLNYPNFTSGHNYSWWVDACNSSGCTTASGTNFSCIATIKKPTVICSPQTSTINSGGTVTWTATASGGSGTYESYIWSNDATGLGTNCSGTSCSVSKSFTNTTATSITKTATVEVRDSAGQTSDSDSCIVTVTPVPDLTVDSLNPSGSVNPGAVTFSGRVVNNGNADANSSSTRLRIDTGSDGSWDTTTANQPTGALIKNGDFETVKWFSVWNAPPCISGTCSHKYEICADVSSAVSESNENNNCTSQIISVVPAGGTCPTATEGYSCSSSSPGTNCSLKSAYTCSVSGESCYFCSPPTAPTISTVRVTNSCINPNHSGSDVDISWTNTGVDWVNISTDSAFGSYYHKNVTGLSTTAPNGFNLNPSNPPQQLTLNPAPSIYYARTYNSTQNSHSQTAVFSINSCTTTAAFDYSLSNNGGITVKQGLSGANTITRTLSAGTPQPVTLSVLSGLPSGASSSFTGNPSSPTSLSTLTITTSPTTPVGSYNITVTGSPLSKTTIFALTVTLATGPGPCNGNKTCDGGETILTCPTDCKPPVCPDKICEAGETTASCPLDCPAGGPSCGNNTCEGNEPVTCPTDCPGPRKSKPWIQIKGDVHSNTGIK